MKYIFCKTINGVLAQLGERRNGIAEVTGSSPVDSTITIEYMGL